METTAREPVHARLQPDSPSRSRTLVAEFPSLVTAIFLPPPPPEEPEDEDTQPPADTPTKPPEPPNKEPQQIIPLSPLAWKRSQTAPDPDLGDGSGGIRPRTMSRISMRNRTVHTETMKSIRLAQGDNSDEDTASLPSPTQGNQSHSFSEEPPTSPPPPPPSDDHHQEVFGTEYRRSTCTDVLAQGSVAHMAPRPTCSSTPTSPEMGCRGRAFTLETGRRSSSADDLSDGSAQSSTTSMHKEPLGSGGKPRIGYCIPHRFQSVKLMQKRTCRVCANKVGFQSKARKCKDCGYVCHLACEPNVPPTCGLSQEFEEMARKEVSPTTSSTSDPLVDDIFQQPLALLAQKENQLVPYFISAIIRQVDAEGLDQEGIYRISGTLSEIEALKRMFAYGKPKLSRANVHVCAGLLKKYLRDIPEPLLTYDLHDAFMDITGEKEREQRIPRLLAVIGQLPACHQAVLVVLLAHLRRVVAQAQVNKMTARNLAVIFGPTLLRGRSETETMAHSGSYCTLVEDLISIDPNLLPDHNHHPHSTP